MENITAVGINVSKGNLEAVGLYRLDEMEIQPTAGGVDVRVTGVFLLSALMV